MISLEQVRLLESKVTRAIDYVKKVSEENTSLKGKLDAYKKRIDELEVLIQQFKDEQSRIEDGILSALDRLNQFEDALENTITAGAAPTSKASAKSSSPPKKEKETAASTEELQPQPAQSEDPKTNEELDIF